MGSVAFRFMKEYCGISDVFMSSGTAALAFRLYVMQSSYVGCLIPMRICPCENDNCLATKSAIQTLRCGKTSLSPGNSN
jgi:hypothetical protein